MAFIFPSAASLKTIGQILTPRLTEGRLGYQLMPIRSEDTHYVMWEQMDNFYGLQQVRGLDGSPPRVKKVGLKRYMVEPGVYGEFMDVDELEMTAGMRPMGQWSGNVDLRSRVAQYQTQLLARQRDLIEYLIWQLLITGSFSRTGPTGNVLHADSFSITTASAAVAWATFATAKPFFDLRAIQTSGPLLGVNFGGGALAIMNRTTYNVMMQNSNANDLGGRRTQGLQPINTLEGVNALLAGDDLPKIVIYDEGYVGYGSGDENPGAFTRYIPNNKVLIVGQRPAGQTVGEYILTRNANNPGMGPGDYTKVFDNGERGVPRRVQVHQGHNGAPVIYYPGAIVVLTVT